MLFPAMEQWNHECFWDMYHRLYVLVRMYLIFETIMMKYGGG
jgi:hypothetical protein